MSKTYITVSGAIFGVIALGQGFRAATLLPVQIGSHEVPVWVSWVAATVAGSLAIWAFRSRG